MMTSWEVFLEAFMALTMVIMTLAVMSGMVFLGMNVGWPFFVAAFCGIAPLLMWGSELVERTCTWLGHD